MSWQQSTLGEECELYQPQTLAKNELDNSGVYKVYGANGVIGTHSKYNHEHPQLLVTCRGATCGTINISEAKSWINGNAMVVKPRSANIDLYFLSHYLHHLDISKAITGAAQPQITRQSLAPIKIQFPPLAQQQRIAAILDKAAEIKAKREQAIAKLDELAQSTFVEMFGDLAINEMNWDTKTLKDISLTKGQYGGGFSAAEFRPNAPRYVRITDITDEGELKPDAVSADGDANDFENYYLADGDLLFARSGATVGKAYLHKSKLPHIYAGYLIRFVIDVEQALPEYVYAVTRTQYYKNWVLSKQNVVAQPNINAQQYGDLKIPVPPLSLQIEYAQFRDALLKQKRNYATTAETLSGLISSLQHQAFTTGFAA